MRWPPLFPSADKTRTKTAPAANKQKVTASADRKSEPMKSARIETCRRNGTLLFVFSGSRGGRLPNTRGCRKTPNGLFKKKKGNSLVSKKRTFKELLQLLPQKEQPEDKAEKEAAEHAPQESEAENAAAAVQHESAYAKLGKAFINRLHLPNELIANASEVESIVNRIISVWEKVEAKTADSAAEENAEESFEDAADANAERLPLPLAGGLAQAPEADYETMSAEQFRTLRKQLKRAAMDGRRIRL